MKRFTYSFRAAFRLRNGILVTRMSILSCYLLDSYIALSPIAGQLWSSVCKSRADTASKTRFMETNLNSLPKETVVQIPLVKHVSWKHAFLISMGHFLIVSAYFIKLYTVQTQRSKCFCLARRACYSFMTDVPRISINYK